MVVSLRSSLAQALSCGLATPGLRRLQLAWAGSALGSWTFFVALAVYAYGAGGAAAVGAAAVVRMVPAGLAAPAAGVLADRFPRRDVILATVGARAALVAVIALAVGVGAPLAVVLGLAALVTVVGTAQRPAQAALVPALAETPGQLGAACALWTGVDNAAFLCGSLLGGLLLAATTTQTALAVSALLFALAAIPIARIPRDPVPTYRAPAARPGRLAALLAGVREIAAEPELRPLVVFLSITTLVEGMADVLVVVLAIELLDLGTAGVGWLNAGWGLGGLAGSAAALALLGHGRLSAGLAGGALLAGAGLVVAGAVPSALVAVAALVVLGVGYALMEAAGLSLLQRLTSDEVLGRAFAVLETSYWLTTGVGALLAPLVIDLLGARGAILAVGACLPLVVLLRWRALARFGRLPGVPEREFAALRRLGMFAPLPLATVEHLARRLVPLSIAGGEVVVRRGEPGDSFYVVAEGVLDVSDCVGRPPPLASGDFFGEIALLRGCARTATVTARGDARLFVLDREAFLTGVGAHPRSGEAAEEVAAQRLEG